MLRGFECREKGDLLRVRVAYLKDVVADLIDESNKPVIATSHVETILYTRPYEFSKRWRWAERCVHSSPSISDT